MDTFDWVVAIILLFAFWTGISVQHHITREACGVSVMEEPYGGESVR